MTQSALAPLRSITHKDANGNPIGMFFLIVIDNFWTTLLTALS